MVFARWRQCASHLIHASLGPPESKSQTASRLVQPLMHSSRQRVTIFTMGRPFPLQTAPFHGESGPHLIRDSLAHLTMTDQQIDHNL